MSVTIVLVGCIVNRRIYVKGMSCTSSCTCAITGLGEGVNQIEVSNA